MNRSKKYKKLFEEILSSQDFQKLEPFDDEEQWTHLNEEEKDLLSLLFVMQGEKQLNEGDGKVLESFRKANLLTPEKPDLMYRQAVAFSRQAQNQYCLKTACQIFELVLSLKPDHFEAWHGLGNTLVLLGSTNQDFDTLQESIKTFENAEVHAGKATALELANFFRDKGLSWYSLGRISGEPSEYRNALIQYQRSARLGLNTCYFWNDYANGICEMAHLLNKAPLIIEAVELYWKAIKLQPTFFAAWYNISLSLRTLFNLHPQEAYYSLANESFEQAVKLEPHKSELWLNWGQLQALRGRLIGETDSLKEACRKFEAADICDPNNPSILSAWGETLLLIGSWTEGLDILKEAQNKIVKSLEMQHDSPRMWCLLANSLFEIGRYYGDEKLYLDSIEKFKHALKLDSKDPILWYGFANAFFALGQLREETQFVYEAAHCYMKAIECGGQQTAQFWNDWGLALMKLANLTDDKRYLESAINKFEQAIRIQSNCGIKGSNDVESLYNLGCAYEFLGDYDENEQIYEKAIQIQKRVLEIDPEMTAAHFNLGIALSRIGESTSHFDSFVEATKHFERVLVHDPEDDQAWNEWGVVLLHMAELTKDPAGTHISQKFYSQAEFKFIQAAALGNCSALYHLACLHSLTKNCDTSFQYLEKCFENHSLPSREDLLQDEWLENVRQTPHFKYFLSLLE